MHEDWEFEEDLRRLAGPVDRRGVWADIEARAAGGPRAIRRPRAQARTGRPKLLTLRVAVFASIAVVLTAALAIGSLVAIEHLGGRTYIVIITDQTTPGSVPGSVSGPSGPGTGTTSVRPGAIAAGEWYSLCVGADGSLWAWGIDRNGRPSDGNPANHKRPTRVGANDGWTAIAAGGQHSLALKSDGSLWAWGSNGSGQLGDGTATDRGSPTRIGSDNDWVAIATGARHSLALKSDGSLWAWGKLDDSQHVGANLVDSSSSPERVGTDSDWWAIAAGGNSSLALKADGSLWGWGAGIGDQWGDDSIYRSLPSRIGSDSDWAAIAAGGSHALALKADGSLREWGTNLGDPLILGTTGYGSPTRIGTETDWVAIAAGGSHSLALKTDGSLWAWGDNHFGAVGNGTSEGPTFPVRIGSDGDWVAIAAGFTHSLAVKTDGSLWAWGEDFGGALGIPQPEGPQRAPIEVLSGARVP